MAGGERGNIRGKQCEGARSATSVAVCVVCPSEGGRSIPFE